MTDIKSRLIDGLCGQGIRLPDGNWLRLDDENLGLIADRLLSTPGIAIIAISEWEREELKAAYEFFVSTCKWTAAAVQAQEPK